MGREAELRAQLLARAMVVVRGPKPTAVLRKLGVRIDSPRRRRTPRAEVLAALAARRSARQDRGRAAVRRAQSRR